MAPTLTTTATATMPTLAQVPLKGHDDDFAPEIPSSAGKGSVTAKYAGATSRIYITCAVLAVSCFFFDASPRLQHAGLALLVPGGSFIGAGGAWLLGFPLTLVLFAVSLFLWFATGNIVAPFLTWPGLALFMPCLPFAAKTTTYSMYVVPLLAATAYGYIVYYVHKDASAALNKRDMRNRYLPTVVKQIARDATSSVPTEGLELQLEELGQLRFLINVANQEMDDWNNFTDIDQFQTSALRYQLNELSYSLSFANKLYMPSFRGGYLQEAQKKVILKSCQKKVLNYWKWEVLWGKLSTNFHPYRVDNIMLTGFLLLALAVYEGATGDDCFSKDGALELVIDDIHKYKVSSGMNALVANDANKGTSLAEEIKQQFREAFIDDFMAADGSVHPIRSHLTGFRIPGLVGAINDFSVGCLSGAVLPDIALRAYAICRKEYMEVDEKGNMKFKGLQGADFIDPGNYKGSKAALYGTSLLAARELGDKVAADSILKLIDANADFQRTEKDGVIWYDNVSLLMKGQIFRGRINTTKGYVRAITQPMSDAVKNGPYLADVEYPEVLVAKAISHTGTDLDLVVYPGTEKQDVLLPIKQLKPNTTYKSDNGREFVSDIQGEATLSVTLEGRTVVKFAQS
ncbi:hypothetical protein AYO20_08119 [Fonsecaea nubica]|uniref:Linalool dehydratase/isomerase domain-containing protein n=1 Tax=Fonsecaea nubica TaxID=856822 RepID=A0A178CQK5_9EURO|nr:hypothetical protein AYO20_08119 [Fonsecaea nubica]OAL31726.1 hypothetical protein AYO20_08119 [Fonsecaea nubica]